MNPYVQLWLDLFPAYRVVESYSPRVKPMSGNCIRSSLVAWYLAQTPAEA